MSSQCPICCGTTTQNVVVLEDLPIFCNVQYRSRAEATDVPKGVIDLHFCADCQHFFNASFDGDLLRYGDAYENSLHFSETFSSFATQLAEQLVDRFDVRSSQVVDVGCGQGDFLKLVCAIGDNVGHGFDPSYDPTREVDDCSSKITFYSIPYSDQHRGKLTPRLLTCRHVLEHIDQPVQFLRDVVGDEPRSAERPVYYLEVPNALFTLRDLSIWDLVYEHCQYFTAGSFSELARRAGLRRISLMESFGGQFLSLEAVKTEVEESVIASSGDGCDLRALASGFRHQVDALINRWQQALREESRRGPCVVWGAGSKGVTFANLMHEPDLIAALVDINPNKVGRFIAGTGHEIVGPEQLAPLRPSSVLVMNPIYEEEVKQQVRGMGCDAVVQVVA